MSAIKKRFLELSELESFHRIDDKHLIDLYIGIDAMSRYTLFLISSVEPQKLKSSQMIHVQIGIRMDKKWGISFSLIKDTYEDIFFHFCEDIIESSRVIKNKDKGTEFICARYCNWQNMLSKANEGLLSNSSIKGLIGEIYFLKEFLIPKYGEEEAVNSWIGPEKADQDFVCHDLWYEVKATVSGAENLKISSIEQLDIEQEGELVIVYLDTTSQSDSLKIVLNGIYNEMLNCLSTENLKVIFSNTLLKLGYYPRAEYDDYPFRFSHLCRYQVTNKFPCVRREKLSIAIINAKYELSIALIDEYLKG